MNKSLIIATIATFALLSGTVFAANCGPCINHWQWCGHGWHGHWQQCNVCTPNLTCGEFTACADGLQTQVCSDGCGVSYSNTQSCEMPKPEVVCTAWSTCTGNQFRYCDGMLEWQSCQAPSDGAAIPTPANPIALNTYIGKNCYVSSYNKDMCFQRMKVFLISMKGTTDTQLYQYLGRIHGVFTKGWDWTLGKYRFTWFNTIAY